MFIILYRHGLCWLTDVPDDPHISIKYPHSFINGDSIAASDFPGNLIVIFYLHHLISLTKKTFPGLIFFFLRAFRIQIFLQYPIQDFHSKAPFSHGCQYLYIKWICIYIPWQLLPDQLYHVLIDHTGLCSLQKKEVPALIIKADPFPGIDPVCIQDNITFLRLPEDFCRITTGKQSLSIRS